MANKQSMMAKGTAIEIDAYYCAWCGHERLLLDCDEQEAARKLRSLGWRQRDGRWCCPWCWQEIRQAEKR